MGTPEVRHLAVSVVVEGQTQELEPPVYLDCTFGNCIVLNLLHYENFWSTELAQPAIKSWLGHWGYPQG